MSTKIKYLLGLLEDLVGKQDALHRRFVRSWERYEETGEHSFLVETAFYLNQLYTGYERIFTEVAKTFGEDVDSMHWHRELLERMKISIAGVRPAVVKEETARCLDELRSFRHFFRHAYDVDLDPEKVGFVVKKAFRLRELWAEDCLAFRKFLAGLLERNRPRFPSD
ncbi:MAG: hypothetical protein HPY90_13980 [Syntrophothermus sp.]|uniref:ribonuclease toxin HepT-like protein n=1 Tax=Syntrophothermus sp. TaxID=2736299 RepID=UPI00258045F7|nr:hypothetical protein [Syntrophothermus sp.]NSW84346.1 hypothetical protein [Syntrophothermus sp.]